MGDDKLDTNRIVQDLDEIIAERDRLRVRSGWLRRAYRELNITRHGLAEVLTSTQRGWANEARLRHNVDARVDLLEDDLAHIALTLAAAFPRDDGGPGVVLVEDAYELLKTLVAERDRLRSALLDILAVEDLGRVHRLAEGALDATPSELDDVMSYIAVRDERDLLRAVAGAEMQVLREYAERVAVTAGVSVTWDEADQVGEPGTPKYNDRLIHEVEVAMAERDRLRAIVDADRVFLERDGAPEGPEVRAVWDAYCDAHRALDGYEVETFDEGVDR